MHILFLNEYYPPDTSATAKMAALVAETLARRHEVTVRRRTSFIRSRRILSVRDLLRRDIATTSQSSELVRRPIRATRCARRVSNYLSYLALAVPRALALRADVILAMTDPPVAGIAGAFVARMAGRPFVYNIRDLYPDMAVGGDIVRPSKWVERWERCTGGR